jgi:hypothetical protein
MFSEYPWSIWKLVNSFREGYSRGNGENESLDLT